MTKTNGTSEAFLRTSNRFSELVYVRDGKFVYTGEQAELAMLLNLHTGRREDSEVEAFIEKKYGWGEGGADRKTS